MSASQLTAFTKLCSDYFELLQEVVADVRIAEKNKTEFESALKVIAALLSHAFNKKSLRFSETNAIINRIRSTKEALLHHLLKAAVGISSKKLFEVVTPSNTLTQAFFAKNQVRIDKKIHHAFFVAENLVEINQLTANLTKENWYQLNPTATRFLLANQKHLKMKIPTRYERFVHWLENLFSFKKNNASNEALSFISVHSTPMVSIKVVEGEQVNTEKGSIKSLSSTATLQSRLGVSDAPYANLTSVETLQIDLRQDQAVKSDVGIQNDPSVYDVTPPESPRPFSQPFAVF